VILRIETDLVADLSLKAHAEYLSVNASYLSNLFKKETGITLTEYVNRARIDHAIFLLNTTDMQIQTIAQNCGVPDVNYFTKLFKRTIGKTPKEYREGARRAPKSEL
jgi:YesN/AraC family two-component response regulator